MRIVRRSIETFNRQSFNLLDTFTGIAHQARKHSRSLLLLKRITQLKVEHLERFEFNQTTPLNFNLFVLGEHN